MTTSEAGFLISVFVFLLIQNNGEGSENKPNIILLIADDLGWNDIGFHGNNQIPTPHIDALAYNGAILNRHYTQSTCTPSRAALMTGKYPIRTGMQGHPLGHNIPAGLPLNETILPQYLKKLGYVTRLVGKWHLGFFKSSYTPIERGFDSFFGYYSGWVRYNDSVTTSEIHGIGIDARRNAKPAGDEFHSKYNTEVFADEVETILKNHNRSKPLFLDVSFTAVHAIFGNLLQVKNIAENEKRFAHIEDPKKRLFAGVLTSLDDAVGKIIGALEKYEFLNNSIILFLSDNGGETENSNSFAQFGNSASNWPLRGLKGSLLEGGVRGVTTLWSPYTRRGIILDKMIHLTDWLPTFLAAAGETNLKDIDGHNQWDLLTGKSNVPPRTQLLVNINEKNNDSAFIDGDWKFVKEFNRSTKYHGISGRDSTYKYNIKEILESSTNKLLSKYNSKLHTEETIRKLRNEAKIDKLCEARINKSAEDLNKEILPCIKSGCLFNIKNDPCEFFDLSSKQPNVMKKMKNLIEEYSKKLVKQPSVRRDPEGADPKKFGGYWSPWM